jgi:Na+-translocating ferredoxin:NAD+ oxidoreductase subunit E
MENQRKTSFGTAFLNGLFFENPVLSLFLGLSVAVLATGTFENALVMSLLIFIDLLVTVCLVSAFRNLLSKTGAFLMAALLSAGIASIASYVLYAFFPSIMVAGYFPYANTLILAFAPFVATSSLVFTKAADALNRRFLESFADALGSGLGYLLALCLVGLLREITGTGELTFTVEGVGQYYVTIFHGGVSLLGGLFGGYLYLGLIAGLHGTIVAALNRHKKTADVLQEVK